MSDMRDMIESVVRTVTGHHKYYGFYRYRVNEDKGPTTQTSRPDLTPVRDDLGLKPLLATDKAFGSSGLFAKLKPGKEVLVGFEGGDSNRPYIAAFIPGEAQGIELVVDGVVKVVGTVSTGSLPVARSPHLVTFLNLLELWAKQVDIVVGPLIAALPPPAPATYSAIVTARTDAASDTSLIASTKLEAE